MRMLLTALACVLAGSITAPAQIATGQKLLDFQFLAGTLDKEYGLYGFKRDVLGYDLEKVKPWLDRVQNSTSDLEFYEICAQYLAALHDAHTVFETPSEFSASLGFTVDIYDGKLLVNAIDRVVLPKSDFALNTGDKLISLDGKTGDEWLTYFSQFTSDAFERVTRRVAAQFITIRRQVFFPRAPQIGDTASVVLESSDGTQTTYSIPWTKTGRPLLMEGPVDVLRFSTTRNVNVPEDAALAPTATPFASMPAYMQSFLKYQYFKTKPKVYIQGEGSLTPIFTLPAGFVQRRNSYFFSGTFSAGDYKIGYLRIPHFEPVPFSLIDIPLATLDREITYFQANTDGLIVDVMRNPGGFGCYAELVASRLIPYTFKTTGNSLRPTLEDVNGFYDALQAAKDGGAETWVIELLTNYSRDVEKAFSETRGQTGAEPEPICSATFDRDPVADSHGTPYAYSKPMILLTDEFSSSAAEIFASMIQDAQRAPLLGFRTNGAGGSVETFNVGVYGEAAAGIARSLVVRSRPVVTPDYPTLPYIENIGVRPDIPYDYMTTDNLTTRGKDFVNTFTQAIVDQIKKSQ